MVLKHVELGEDAGEHWERGDGAAKGSKVSTVAGELLFELS